MHRNTAVAAINIHEESGAIDGVCEVFAPLHMPLGTFFAGNETEAGLLNKWWAGRAIPASRLEIGAALEALGVVSPGVLPAKCFGLSLSDNYWICPENIGLEWSKINFFENDFSRDVGEALFGVNTSEKINFNSPDNTSDGMLQKRWIIRNGERFLQKSGSGRRQQEPFNEAAAAAICRRLKIPHAEYLLEFEGGKPYSFSKNFLSEKSELIPFAQIISILPNLSDDKYNHLTDCAAKLGLPDIRGGLDRMIVLDCIIMNEDRHFNNFGMIRDSETLQWQGFAPIYDSGNSLWYTSDFIGEPIASKPFCSSHSEQIKLVTDFSWYDEKALIGLEDELRDIFGKASTIKDENKAEIIKHAVLRAKAIPEYADRIMSSKKPTPQSLSALKQ
jgi:hypothetical protein